MSCRIGRTPASQCSLLGRYTAATRGVRWKASTALTTSPLWMCVADPLSVVTEDGVRGRQSGDVEVAAVFLCQPTCCSI